MPRRRRSPRRLVVAVTGHRDIDARDRGLARLVRGECRRLREAHPGGRFAVLSPLAEGADRLVARIAPAVLAAPLIVPLPLPLDHRRGYLADFPRSRGEFHRLLASAEEVLCAPLRSRGGKWQRDGAARNRQYAWAGAYIAEHADILLAIWDGRRARGVGGTGQVVAWFLAGKVPKAHSTLRLAGRPGSLPPGRPRLLVRIDPATGEVSRVPVRRQGRRGRTIA